MTPVYFLNIVTWMYLRCSHLNDQLHNVSTWLKANKLSINVKKTELMIFRPRQQTSPINWQIENNVLEQVDNTKFLGVYIDQHLTRKTHVNLLWLRFLKLSSYFIKLNTICPQNLFLHYSMPLFIHILLTTIWFGPLLTSPTCNEFTYYGKEQSGRSLRLTTRLQVNLFLQI